MHISPFFASFNGQKGFYALAGRPLRAEFNILASKQGWKGDRYFDMWCHCLESEIREYFCHAIGSTRANDLVGLCFLLLDDDDFYEKATAKECEQVRPSPDDIYQVAMRTRGHWT
jgi:hypothetical protein